jgi:hypothetical protein
MGESKLEPEKNKAIERIAALVHNLSINKMKYLFSKCEKHPTGEYTIPKWVATQWQKQMSTEYRDAPPEEQEADRREAKKYIELILQIIQKEFSA